MEIEGGACRVNNGGNAECQLPSDSQVPGAYIFSMIIQLPPEHVALIDEMVVTFDNLWLSYELQKYHCLIW